MNKRNKAKEPEQPEQQLLTPKEIEALKNKEYESVEPTVAVSGHQCTVCPDNEECECIGTSLRLIEDHRKSVKRKMKIKKDLMIPKGVYDKEKYMADELKKKIEEEKKKEDEEEDLPNLAAVKKGINMKAFRGHDLGPHMREKIIFCSYMSMPANLRPSMGKMAKALGVSSPSLSAWRIDPKIQDIIMKLAKAHYLKYLPDVYDVVTKRAMAGDTQHVKMFLEYVADMNKDNPELQKGVEVVISKDDIKMKIAALRNNTS